MKKDKKTAAKNPDIAERKRAEETLRRLAAVVRASNDAIIVQDIDGRITAWNRGAELMYGYSEAEALGMNIDQLSPPDKVSEQKEFTRRLIAGEAVTSFETQRVTKDGSILDVWLTVTKLVEDPADSIISTGCDITMPIGVALIERNITLRKKAEAELRESEEKYREVVERANDGIIILQDAIIQYSNQRVSDIAGYEASEIIGASMANYIHPDELTKVLDRYKRRMAGEHVPQIYDTVLVHKDGNSVNVELNAGIINYQGKPADLVIVRDITERKKIEETLRQKAFLLDSSSSIIGTCDLDGRMTYANPAFLRGLGYDTLEEILERQFGEFWMVQDQLEEIMTALLGNVGPRQWIGELRVKRKDGSLFNTQVSATTVFDVSGKPISLMSTSIDITERKQAEEALAFKNIILSTQQETSLDGILVVDDNEKIISYNQRFVELWGIPFDVVESKSDDRALRSVTDKLTNPEEFIRKVQHLYESRQETSQEEIILKDGRKFDRYSAPMLGADGKYFGRVWYFRDITERKKAEEALRESEDKYRSLFNQSTEGIYLHDFEGRILDVNEKTCEQSGYSKEEWLGRTVFDGHPTQSRMNLPKTEILQAWSQWAPGQRAVLEAEHQRKDGTVYPVEVSTGIVRYGDSNAVLAIVKDITERKKAEEELRETNERYKSLFNHSLEAIYIADMNGDFTDANPYALKLLGYEKEEITSLNFLSLVDKESTELTAKISEEIIKTGSQKEIAEYKVIKKDGTYAWIETHASLLYKDRKPVGLQGIARDITERKLAEEALRKQAQLLMATGEMAKVGGWELDLSTKEVTLTEEVSRIHGLKPGHKLKLEEALNFYAPKFRTDVELTVKKAAETGESYDIESLFIPKGSKDKIWVRSLGKAVYGDGKIVKLAGTFQNIDKYKKAEALLQESEEKYRLLAENASDVIAVMDMNLRPIYMSPSITRLLGYSVEEAMARGITGSLTPESVKVATKGLAETIAEEQKGKKLEPVTIDLEFIRKDGSKVWVTASVALIRGSDGQITEILSILHDITERKRAEEDLIKYKGHLEETVKERTEELGKAKIVAEDANKAKSDFLANMSHEIRTPLSSIIGFSELLFDETKGPLNDDQKKYLGYVTSSGQHLLSLINDILDLSKVEAGKMELAPTSFSIKDLLKNSLSFVVEKATKHNIRLLSEISADVDVIEADERKVKQIIYNLLSNAVKFTPDGGSVTVGADVVYHNSAAIPSGIRKGLPDTEYVLVSVKDTGIGIARKDQSKIFTEFQQIEEPSTKKYEGTGLGLALSQKLVILHDGKIWFESRGEGKGSTFYFILPLKTPPKT